MSKYRRLLELEEVRGSAIACRRLADSIRPTCWTCRCRTRRREVRPCSGCVRRSSGGVPALHI
ncbi:hypothetical protein ACU4GD_10260 [Cupriavidus basilensis]